jgi:hypothetical protein
MFGKSCLLIASRALGVGLAAIRARKESTSVRTGEYILEVLDSFKLKLRKEEHVNVETRMPKGDRSDFL